MTINLYSKSDALLGDHEVLGRVSAGYPSPWGRLDTRYSPVRRSTSGKSKLSPPFPLDLHVLGL